MEQTVLYVCTGNRFRSVLAEVITEQEREDIDAISAGTEGGEAISPVTKALLQDHNATGRAKERPEQVRQHHLEQADRIVAMQPEHQEYLEQRFDLDGTPIEVWHVQDHPEDIDPTTINTWNEIRSHVRELSKRPGL